MGTKEFVPSGLMRKDASGQIARQLREAIAEGIWEPGERLPTENELGETFDVARATAREALKLLSATGIVTSVPGGAGGTFVTAPDADDVAARLSESILLWFRVGNVSVHNVDEARRMLELDCVELAAQRRTEEDLAAIRRPVDAAADLTMDMQDWLDLDLEFHQAISRAAKNKILELAMMAVHLARPATNTTFVHLLGREDVWRQHEAIYKAIEAGDPAEARNALTGHVNYLDNVRKQSLDALQMDDVAVSALQQGIQARRRLDR